jgi:hypothetical protein
LTESLPMMDTLLLSLEDEYPDATPQQVCFGL